MRRMKIEPKVYVERWMAALGLAVAMLLSLAAWAGAQAGPVTAPALNSYASGDFFFPAYPAASDRIGMGVRPPIASYPYAAALRPGWYVEWTAKPDPLHPAGAEYARTIVFTVNTNSCGMNKIPASQRSQVTASITGTALLDNLRANPGALWLIGNEPDSIYNCSPIMPGLYAELYHEFYTFIKAHDPSARIAIGAIVQPSPLRLEYLDKVLAHYQALYGEKLPTDLWNIHLYAFPERAGQAGAGVPPDASSPVGWTYTWAQTVDVGLVARNLGAMRQWMAERGERDKPLIITEFGQLVPDDGTYTLDGLTFTRQVSRDYLLGSMTYFLTATHPVLGYPADGGRLVQMWAWYALYDPFYGGNLADPDGTLTLAGQAFAQLAAQHWAAYADLYPAPLATPAMPPVGGGAFGVSLTVQVHNHGNALAPPVPARLAQYDYASGELLASRALTLSQVLTRYAGAQPQANAQWVLTPGAMYTLAFELDPEHMLDHVRRSPQSLAYSVGWIPDLALTALTANVPGIFLWRAPTTLTLAATVSNLGNLGAAASEVRFSARGASGSVYLEQTVPAPALAPGVKADVVGALVLPLPGWYTVTASVISDAGLDWRVENNSAGIALLAAAAQWYLPCLLAGPPSANLTFASRLALPSAFRGPLLLPQVQLRD